METARAYCHNLEAHNTLAPAVSAVMSGVGPVCAAFLHALWTPILLMLRAIKYGVPGTGTRT